MFNPDNAHLNKMRNSAVFLGEPADGVVRELVDLILLERTLLVRVSRYEFGGYTLEKRSKDQDAWAIVSGPECWGRDGKWAYEPLPSNRDEEFVMRTRWTLREALDEIVKRRFIGDESTFKEALDRYLASHPE